jgi:hypothetical protein
LLPFSSTSLTEITVPLCGFSFAVSGIMIPEAVFSSVFLFLFFFSFLWFLHVFQGSGFFMFASYFSRSLTMDIFPSMGKHIEGLAMQVFPTHCQWRCI